MKIQSIFLLFAVSGLSLNSEIKCKETSIEEKVVIYQVFPRLFGNPVDTFEPWGTIETNGVGKFEDFTDKALIELKQLGVTHMWYTGVPHHASLTDYRAFGIPVDDADVVKGRAGSPYAVRDYYQVNPDLAVDPQTRMEEFEALIERTHSNGLKVMIDIVPNHVARSYHSLNNPRGVRDFGASDDTTVAYARDNNFYYVVGQDFEVPNISKPNRIPDGLDGLFDESPAKWTGNGARSSKPDELDWYETVKINFGVRPDDTHDFPEPPEDLKLADAQALVEFWKTQDVPDSWTKFRDITEFWLAKGVDGFRFDMAEMVPVAFWSYLNSNIKSICPKAILVAEVYQPELYRSYLSEGKMDFLYNKVDLYDTIKAVMSGEKPASAITETLNKLEDIAPHMLHFMENHDEQRIASPDFAGDPHRGKPAVALSALIGKSPVLIYFGQEVGEDGSEMAGFGKPSRTSIFDYIGVPAHQRWMNAGKFDGGMLSTDEQALRQWYGTLLNMCKLPSIVSGQTQEFHSHNTTSDPDFPSRKVFPFARWAGQERLIVVVNFSDSEPFRFDLRVPAEWVACQELSKPLRLYDLFKKSVFTDLQITENDLIIPINIEANGVLVYRLEDL